MTTVNERKACAKSIVFFTAVFLCGAWLGVLSDYLESVSFSSFYWIVVAVVLIGYYRDTIVDRSGLKKVIVSCGGFMLFFCVLRAVKYADVFSPSFRRFLWYLYYIPILAIPTLLLYASFLVDAKQKKRVKPHRVFAVISVLFGVAVLTNDLHQATFRFQEDFLLWDAVYSRGPVYYGIAVWIILLYLLTFAVIVKKCKLASTKQNWWMMPLVFVISGTLFVLNATEYSPKIDGVKLIMFPDLMCYFMALFIQCSIRLGLIPVKANFNNILKMTSLPVKFTDEKTGEEYASVSSRKLSDEMNDSEENGNVKLHTLPLPYGTGYWLEDVSEVNEINRKLTEANEQLNEESVVIKLNNDLKEKQTVIRQRTRLYDDIARKNSDLADKINTIVENTNADDSAQYSEKMAQVCLYGAFIKRYSNLLLLTRQNEKIHISELGMAVAETLRYLSRMNIVTQYQSSKKSVLISAKASLLIFECYKEIVLQNFSEIKGIYATIEEKDEIILKFVVEGVSLLPNEKTTKNLDEYTVRFSTEYEDDVSFLRFCIPKMGGETDE